MRCEICDFDEETGFNQNVDVFSDAPRVNAKNNKVLPDSRDGAFICTACRYAIRDVQNDWYLIDAGKRAVDKASEERYSMDKEQEELAEYEEIDLFDDPEQEPGEPGDLEDPVPELQDVGEGHK